MQAAVPALGEDGRLQEGSQLNFGVQRNAQAGCQSFASRLLHFSVSLEVYLMLLSITPN